MEKKTLYHTLRSVCSENKGRRINGHGNRTGRQLRMEPLEQRELLAVSFAEYNQIRELYTGFELASDWSQVQVVDLQELSRESLFDAVTSATSCPGDDLIVVRTSLEASSIAFGDQTLDIDYDAGQYGALTIVSWGETLLELTGQSTLVNVSAGKVQLGAMKLTVQGTTAADAEYEFVTSDPAANLSTSRMLFVRDSQAPSTTQVYTDAGSDLFSASVAGTQSSETGYYSVEFQLTATESNPTETKWAYVTGLDTSGVTTISTALAGGYGSTDPLSAIGGTSGYFVDAEKSEALKDGDLCWAATSSNMLWYSGWAKQDMTPSFSSEDSVLDYFKDYWPNTGGNIGTANSWFLNGDSYVGGGALYNDVNYGTLGGSMAISGGMKFANMVEKLRADNAIGLSVGWFTEGAGEVLTSRYGGHAITLWGYVYDTDYTAGTTGYYRACIIADSDDNKFNGTNAPNVLCSCDLTWDSTNNEYYFDSYKSGAYNGWLETFYWLEPNTLLAHKPQLARTTVSLSTVQTTSPTVACQISRIDNAVSYTLEYSKTPAFATGETTSVGFTYDETNNGVYSVGNLDPGTLYYFRVKCWGNGVDYRNSEWSATKSITTETIKTPLASPVLTTSSSDNNSVTISLSAIDNASGYRVWFSSVANDFSAASSYTFSQSGTQTLYGLKAGTMWYFQAAALGDGQTYSDSERSSGVSMATTGTATSDDRNKGNIVTTLLDVVDSTDGLISLREAIKNCGSNGTTTDITFAENLRGGTITLSALNNLASATTSLLITKSLTITGLTGVEDTSPAITIDGNRTNKVFYFYNTKNDGTEQTNSISNLVVTGGALKIDYDGFVHGGAGIEVLRAKLTVDRCIVEENAFESSGSGISPPSVYGAGIYARNSQLVVRNSLITDNTINISGDAAAYLYGAGIASSGGTDSYPASLTLTDSIVTENTITGRSTTGSIFAFGAAISNSDMSVLSISDCELLSNRVTVNMENTVGGSASQLSANVRGGALYCDSTGNNRIDRTVIQNNFATAQAVSDTNQAVADVSGTGIHNAGTLVVSNTLIADNSARTQAASETEYEFAQVHGTAVYVASDGKLDLIGSTLSGNEASASAADSESVRGALYLDSEIGFANVYNSIIASNFATHGGDIALDDGATVHGANNLADFNGWDSVSTNNIDFKTNDELFVNAAEGDYHLVPTSAAALKADPGYALIHTAELDWTNLTDLDGAPRVAGSGIDIGAYELAVVSEEFSMIETRPSMTLNAVSDTQLKAEIVAVDRVQYYTVLYRVKGDTQWKTGYSTWSLQFSLDELTPDTEYEFMVVGVQETSDSTHTWVSPLFSVSTQSTGGAETPSLTVTTLLDIVDPNDGVISFREAAAYLPMVSGSDKRISFDSSLAGKTIELKHGVISINESVTIDASELVNRVAISGSNLSSILNIGGSTTEVTLKNLAFVDGYSNDRDGGAIYSDCSLLTVEGCLFQDNKVTFSSATGGGAIASWGWELIVESSEFYGNSVVSTSDSSAGGAIWAESKSTITDCVFVQNSLTNNSLYVVGGGAIGTQSELTVAASVFVENTAPNGGAILAFATLTVSDSILERNSAAIYGGGICTYSDGNIVGTTFVGNQSQYGGGFCGYGDITRSVFRSNVAEYGGGIHLSNGDASSNVVECLIAGNRAESDWSAWGGGMSIMGAATIANCTIADNKTANYGGGLACLWATATVVQNSIIVNNVNNENVNSDVDRSTTSADPIGKNVLTRSTYGWDAAASTNIVAYDLTQLFVNAEAGDYSLVRDAASKAVDAGNNDFVTSDRVTDLAGSGRIYGVSVDLGAYEVQVVTRYAVCGFTIDEESTTKETIQINISDAVVGRTYKVQCSDSSNFDNLVYNQDVSGTGVHAITGLNAAQDYFIRVQTVASTENDASIWTPVQVWTTQAQTLGSPVLTTLAKADEAVQFSWDAVPGATAYLVEYSQDVNFAGSARQVLYENAGAFRIDNVKPLGTWYFRVTALGVGTYDDSQPSIVKSVALVDLELAVAMNSSSFTSCATESAVTIATFTVEGSTDYKYVLSFTGHVTLPIAVVDNKLVTNGTMSPGEYSVGVKVEDNQRSNVSNEVTVSFTVSTTPPTDLVLSQCQGLPNREAGLTIGTLSAPMYDEDTPYWFTLVDTGDAALFELDTTTNTLKTAATLTASMTYHVTVKVENAGGAYQKVLDIETVAAPVATPESETYSVAAGCQIQLSGSGTDDPAHEITGYFWDIDNDGIADFTGQNVWVRSDDLTPVAGGNVATVGFWVRNELGAQSETRNLSVMIESVAPSMETRPTSQAVDNHSGRLLRVRADLSVIGRENVKRWQFNWGDQSNSTVDVVASSMCCSHYFAAAGGFDIKLTVTLTDDTSHTFSLLYFEFETVPDSTQQATSAVLEEPVAAPLEELDSSQEQTALDRALIAVADEWQPCTPPENVLVDLAVIEKMKKKRVYL